KHLNTDDTGQLTLKELKQARADIAAGVATFTPAEKRAITQLEKIISGERPLPPVAAPASRRSPLSVRLDAARASDGPNDAARLNSTQRAVLQDVTKKAAERSKAAHAGLLQVAKSHGYSAADVVKALEYIKK